MICVFCNGPIDYEDEPVSYEYGIAHEGCAADYADDLAQDHESRERA